MRLNLEFKKERTYILLLLIALVSEILAVEFKLTICWLIFGVSFYCYYFLKADKISKIAEEKAKAKEKRR